MLRCHGERPRRRRASGTGALGPSPEGALWSPPSERRLTGCATGRSGPGDRWLGARRRRLGARGAHCAGAGAAPARACRGSAAAVAVTGPARSICFWRTFTPKGVLRPTRLVAPHPRSAQLCLVLTPVPPWRPAPAASALRRLRRSPGPGSFLLYTQNVHQLVVSDLCGRVP